MMRFLGWRRMVEMEMLRPSTTVVKNTLNNFTGPKGRSLERGKSVKSFTVSFSRVNYFQSSTMRR